MRVMGRRVVLVSVVLVALLGAACGSTVQVQRSARVPGSGNELQVTTDGNSVDTGTGENVAGLGTGSFAAGGTAGPSASGSSASGFRTAVTSAVQAKKNGPGITDTTIYIGDIYAVNADALNQAAGANGISQGDPQADARAVIDDINKKGGIAGRKVEPVFFAFDSTSTQTIDQQYAAACAHFTQDEPRVFAVLGQGTASYRRCIGRAGAVIISNDLPTVGAAEFAAIPMLIDTGSPNLDRIATNMVDALAEQNYFQPWDVVNARPATAGTAKVGIVTHETAAFRYATDHLLVPALKALGYTPQVAYVAEVETASDYSKEAAAVQNAELSFSANRVDHVIMFDDNGSMSLFFMNQASSQHYHPRYGGHSGSAFEVLRSTRDIAEAEQFNGAMGLGWIPGLDLPANENPDNGPYANNARRQCLKVMSDHGQTFADPNAQGIAFGYCNSLWLLRAALNLTPSVINNATFVASVEKLGDSFEAAGQFGEHLAPGHHDGVSKGYRFAHAPACGCFRYNGPLRTIK